DSIIRPFFFLRLLSVLARNGSRFGVVERVRAVSLAVESFRILLTAISLASLPVRSRLRRRHALHRNRQTAVSIMSQRDELAIGANRFKHRIDARFHHLFRAYRLVTLVLIEV